LLGCRVELGYAAGMTAPLERGLAESGEDALREGGTGEALTEAEDVGVVVGPSEGRVGLEPREHRPNTGYPVRSHTDPDAAAAYEEAPRAGLGDHGLCDRSGELRVVDPLGALRPVVDHALPFGPEVLREVVLQSEAGVVGPEVPGHEPAAIDFTKRHAFVPPKPKEFESA
jgi:hypothetical protein